MQNASQSILQQKRTKRSLVVSSDGIETIPLVGQKQCSLSHDDHRRKLLTAVNCRNVELQISGLLLPPGELAYLSRRI